MASNHASVLAAHAKDILSGLTAGAGAILGGIGAALGGAGTGVAHIIGARAKVVAATLDVVAAARQVDMVNKTYNFGCEIFTKAVSAARVAHQMQNPHEYVDEDALSVVPAFVHSGVDNSNAAIVIVPRLQET